MIDKIEKRTFRVSDFRAIGGNKIQGFIPYESESVDMGGWTEILKPGCFSESLRSGNRIMSFWNHDTKQPLGSTEAGTLKVEDRQDGLSFTIYAPDTNWGRDAHESVRRGDTVDVSFGFRVPNDGDEWKDQTRNIIKAELFEVSPVSWGAYPETEIQARQYRSKKTMDEKEIRRQLGDLAEKAEMITDKANSDSRQLTKDENHEVIDLMSRFDNLAADLENKGHTVQYFRDSGLEGVNKWMGEVQRPAVKPEFENRAGITPLQRYQGITVNDPEIRLFNKYLIEGRQGLSLDERKGFEKRALQMDSDTAGGFLVAPEQFVVNILTKAKAAVFVRQHATLHTCTNAHSLGQPCLDNDVEDGDWTAEIKTGSEDDTMDFDKRELFPHPVAKRLKVSEKLLRANPNVSAFVEDRLTYKFSVTEEMAFIGYTANYGTGAQCPLGVFNDTVTIGTDRDCSEGNTATAIKGDGLINAEGMLKTPYRKKARWLFHRDAIKQIRKLKTGEGEYLWAMGLSGTPSKILDYPYDISEFCRNTFSASEYVGILADWTYYHIADALDIQVKVLDQLYAETAQVGFIARKETDGMAIFGEPFVRVKLGA